MKRNKIITILLVGCMLVGLTGCRGREKKHSDLVFNLTKTIGTVTTVDDNKLTMNVTSDDKYFKSGDDIVVTFESLYEDDESTNSDILKKIDSVSTGDTVYVLYDEGSKKDKVVNVEYVVRVAN